MAVFTHLVPFVNCFLTLVSRLASLKRLSDLEGKEE